MSDPISLSGRAVLRLLDALVAPAGAPLRQSRQLADAMGEADSLDLVDAIAALFPGQEPAAAQNAFRAARQRINGAFVAAELGLELLVSENRHLPMAERKIWFEGPDPASESAADYTNLETGDLPAAVVASPARAAHLPTGRPKVVLFISYATADSAMVEPLLEELRSRWAVSRDYEFVEWKDNQSVRSAEAFHPNIIGGIDDCHLGLQFLTRTYLIRNYIREHERPRFVSADRWRPGGRERIGLPIAVQHLDYNRDDVGEFGERTPFRLRIQGLSYAFDECGPKTVRRRKFADACFEEILKTLKQYEPHRAPPSGPGDLDTPTGGPRKLSRPGDDAVKDLVAHDREGPIIPAVGRPVHLRRGLDLQAESGDRVSAQAALEAWLDNPDGPPFFALLGEYGMGKTVNCKQFAQNLLARRRAGEKAPLPIYLDLRHARGLFPHAEPGGPTRRFDAPRVDVLIEAILAGSWKATEAGRLAGGLRARDVRDLVAQGAVIIFDGFDEVAVHLLPEEARDLLRQLWSILPEADRRVSQHRSARGAAPTRPGARMLLSCRSHYFRSLQDEIGFLTGNTREGIEARHYQALLLLPFADDQIRAYLLQVLGSDARADEALALIAATHNLTELASRPVLLREIVPHLDALERLRLEGKAVNAARLYDILTDGWFDRDDGKHTLAPRDKRELMERLAGALWALGERSWTGDELDDWLDLQLREDPRLRDLYAGQYTAKTRELLREDLRTSTMVVRQGDENFRFAHTSVQEYFLARHMLRRAAAGDVEAWALPMPSDETLAFLIEAGLDNAPDKERERFIALVKGLLRDGYRVRASELALKLWLLAEARARVSFRPGRLDLAEANLQGWWLKLPPAAGQLRGSNLAGADLTGAILSGLDLRGTNFVRARLRGAELADCDLSDSNIAGADFTGGLWRTTGARNLDWAAATMGDVRLIGCPDGPSGSHVSAWRSEATCVDWTNAYAATAFGHSDAVNACAWSPDGRSLLSGGEDGTVRLWDVATGEERQRFEGHEGEVSTCAWSPDGSTPMSGGDDGTVRLWDPATGKERQRFDGGGGVNACAWSPDSHYLLSANEDGTMRLWDVETGVEQTRFEGHGGAVLTCVWSPDGGSVLSGSADATARLWNAATGEERHRFGGHTGWVRACSWSPDGLNLLTGDDEGTIRVWDATRRIECRQFRGHEEGVNECAWSPDGRNLLSAGEDWTVRLWDIATGEERWSLEGKTCAWSPDGRSWVSGGEGGELSLRDSSSGMELSRFVQRRGWVWSCAWSPDGRSLLSGSNDGIMRHWDAETGEELRSFSVHESWVRACGWSPDGKYILSCGDEGTVRLWDAATGEERRRLEGHEGIVLTCVWSPDGHSLLSGGDDAIVRLWDMATGEERGRFEGHTGGIWACAWSPDGRSLLSASADKTMRLWDVATENERHRFEGHGDEVNACAWSPDGQRILSAGDDGMVRLWDAATGQELRRFKGHKHRVWACAWSPDGQSALSASSDGTIRSWDVETGRLRHRFEGHKDSVRACVWSPDGQRILSSGGDGTVRIWDSASGTPLRRWHLFKDGSALAVDGPTGSPLYVSDGAWRHVHWRFPGLVNGAGLPFVMPLELHPHVGVIPKTGWLALSAKPPPP